MFSPTDWEYKWDQIKKARILLASSEECPQQSDVGL